MVFDSNHPAGFKQQDLRRTGLKLLNEVKRRHRFTDNPDISTFRGARAQVSALRSFSFARMAKNRSR